MNRESGTWWNSFTSLLWTTNQQQTSQIKMSNTETTKSEEVKKEEEEPKSENLMAPQKNKSILYTIVANNVETQKENEEVVEEVKVEEVIAEAKAEENGKIKNSSSLYKIVSSQQSKEDESSESDTYHEIVIQNINFETQNTLSIAENALYYMDDEDKKEKEEIKDAQPKRIPSFKVRRPASDIQTAKSTETLNKARPKSDSESQVLANLKEDGMTAIRFSFFENSNKKLSSKEYLPMDEKSKNTEEIYASPKNSINSRENSPSTYIGPEDTNSELFYAASEIIHNRPPTPFERKKEEYYEDLDLEKEELPALPTTQPVQNIEKEIKDEDKEDDYTDVDVNEYCQHRERQQSHLKKLTLLRQRKTKTGKVRSKLNRAWKSVVGWMNEEKEKLERLEDRFEDKLVDAKGVLDDKIEDAKELLEVIQRRQSGHLTVDRNKRKSRESLHSKHKSQIYERSQSCYEYCLNDDKRTADETSRTITDGKSKDYETAKVMNGNARIEAETPEVSISLPSSPETLRLNGEPFDFSYFNYDFNKIVSTESTLSDSDLYVDMSAKLDEEGDYAFLKFATLKKMKEGGESLKRAGFMKNRLVFEGQSGFEDLRKYIKQGGDFCKELSVILQERSEAEAQYAKSLSKLSSKLLKTSKDAVGSVSEAWQKVGAEMESQSEVHRAFANALSDEVVKPLKYLIENQHRIRKGVESVVDKTGKNLAEWRQAEMKSKKQSFLCARENEKLQDAMLDVRNNKNASTLHLHHHHKNLTDKESAKLDVKRRKAEESVKKADVEYYSFCVRAERSRLDWESAVTRGSQCFQALEEERLTSLKNLAGCYLRNFREIGPRLVQCGERLSEPILTCDVSRDIQTVVSLKSNGQPPQEQLLPDFYAEHVTLAMNRERRRQALIKLLQLIRQDLEREKRGKQGVENLQRALLQTPNFGAEESQQNVDEKLHHMKSMLIYLEAARYKVQCALSELDGRVKQSHPLAQHIQVTRDRQGLQQSVLKVPQWVRNEGVPVPQPESPDWADREAGDGTSVQPDSDFDEFSSVGSDKDYQQSVYNVISECSDAASDQQSLGTCRALYEYSAKLYDELNLQTGDVIKIHDKQPDGWWLGELHGVVGIFPATYVEEIK